MTIRIYHNPRCSKSRATLALLEERGIEPEIVRYLDETPSAAELRELLVTGFVRPDDISRRNEITYDKIASARIAYGGRGIISSAQSPRRGQAAADAILPF